MFLSKIPCVCYKRLKKFISLTFSDKCILLESYIMLGYGRFMVLMFPFNRIKSLLEKDLDKMSDGSGINDKTNIVKQVKWCVGIMSRHTPWKSNCYAQAIAAQNMLRRRGIPGTVYFGVAKEDDKTLSAHAWLICGDICVTGYKYRKEFNAVVKIGQCGDSI